MGERQLPGTLRGADPWSARDAGLPVSSEGWGLSRCGRP